MKYCECCRQLIDEVEQRNDMSANEIIVEASTFCNERITDVMSKSRRRKLVLCRYMIFDILYSDRNRRYTYSEIGKMFGGLDHSTLIHGINVVKNYCEVYPEFRVKHMELHKLIYGHTKFFRFM